MRDASGGRSIALRMSETRPVRVVMELWRVWGSWGRLGDGVRIWETRMLTVEIREEVESSRDICM